MVSTLREGRGGEGRDVGHEVLSGQRTEGINNLETLVREEEE